MVHRPQGKWPRWPRYQSSTDALLEIGPEIAPRTMVKCAVYDSLDAAARSHGGARPRSIKRRGEPLSLYLMKRPKKSLHPFVLVIHDCLLRARSLCSVNPIVRWTRGGFVEVVSVSLMAASVCSFLTAAAPAVFLVLEPNSLPVRLFIISFSLVG